MIILFIIDYIKGGQLVPLDKLLKNFNIQILYIKKISIICG